MVKYNTSFISLLTSINKKGVQNQIHFNQKDFLLHFQDVPSFNLMLTLFLLSYDRLRALKYPAKPKIAIRWALCIIWFLSIAFVLPYYAHIKYLELSVRKYSQKLHLIIMDNGTLLNFLISYSNFKTSYTHRLVMDRCVSLM